MFAVIDWLLDRIGPAYPKNGEREDDRDEPAWRRSIVEALSGEAAPRRDGDPTGWGADR